MFRRERLLSVRFKNTKLFFKQGMQSICEYYEYRKIPTNLSPDIKKIFDSLLYIEKSQILMYRSVCIYLLLNMKTNPSSPIEIKANALMIKHLNLLHRQTAMWIYSYLSNGLSTFHCDIPGFNLNCAGIV